MNAPAVGWRLEQHIGTILQAIILALLGWSLKTNVETVTAIGVLQAEVRALQTNVSQGTNDRYRGSDAARDFASVWAEIQRHDARITNLEGKHR